MGVSSAAIALFENGGRLAPNLLRADILEILEAAGVEFIAENGGGPGVRLRKAT